MKFYIQTKKKAGMTKVYTRVRRAKPYLDVELCVQVQVDIQEWKKSQRSISAWNNYIGTDKGRQANELLTSIEKSIKAAIRDGVVINGNLHTIVEGDPAHNIIILREAVDMVIRDASASKDEERKIRKENQQRIKRNQDSLVAYLEQCIDEYQSGKRTKNSDSPEPVSPSYIKSVKGTKNQLIEFQKRYDCQVTFGDVNQDFEKRFKNFLIQKGYLDSTMGKIIGSLKTHMAYAFNEGRTDNHEYVKMRAPKGKSEQIWLDDTQIQQLYALRLDTYEQAVELLDKVDLEKEKRDSLKHALKRDIYRRNLIRARDIFMIGVLIGQRISDYSHVSLDMITQDGDDFWLRLTQQKTRKGITLLVDKRVIDILSKYGGSIPHMADQHVNTHIKICGLLCGWTQPSGIRISRGGKSIESSKKFYEAISSHTARRSFVTQWYAKGVSGRAIMSATGHSSEATMMKYMRLNVDEKARLAAEEFKSHGMNHQTK